MQTTYRLNVQDIDYNFFESFKTLFKNKEVNITVKEVEKAEKDQIHTHFASQKILAQDWLNPDEEKAWQNL